MLSDRFENIRRDLGTSTSRAVGEWWLRTGLIAIHAADWPTAFERLEHLEDVGREAFTPEAWQELTQALLRICTQGKLVSRVESVVSRLAPLAWPDGNLGSSTTMFASIAEDPTPTTQKLVDAFVRHFANAWQPFYARGLMGQSAAQANDFETAGRLRSDPKFARHTNFRAAALLLLSHRQIGRARELMRSVRREEFTRSETLWYVVAMAESPNRLDQRRAFDTLEDILEAVALCRPDAMTHSLIELRNVIRSIAASSPKLSAEETERLATIVLKGPFDEPERAALKAHVELKAAVQRHASEPLESITQLPTTLGAKTLARAQAWNGLAPDVHDPYSQALFDIGSARPLNREVWNRIAESGEPAAILPILRVIASTDRPTEIEDILVKWSQSAPKPSFGFWALAGYLQTQKLARAGACVAQRAIEEQEPTERDDRLAIVTRSLNWALRKGSDSQLRFWLEAAQPNADGKSSDA